MMGSRTLGLQDMAGHITISKILTQAGSFHDLVPKKEVILTLFAGPLIALFLFWKCDEAKVGSLRLFPTLLLPEPLGAAAPKKDFMVLRSAVTQHAALASTARNRSSLKDTLSRVPLRAAVSSFKTAVSLSTASPLRGKRIPTNRSRDSVSSTRMTRKDLYMRFRYRTAFSRAGRT